MKWRAGRIFVATAGLAQALIALIMLAAPGWFFQHIGYFPPYNRHYVADTASFSLGLGLALLWAAWDLPRRRGLIGIAALASVLHAVNHGLDAAGAAVVHWIIDVVPLTLLAVGLSFAWLRWET